MRVLQGIPPVIFILWAVAAMSHAAYGESYEQLQQQIADQQTQIFNLQENAANDEIDVELCRNDGSCVDKGIDPVGYDGAP